MHDEVTLQIIVCYSEYPYHHQRGHGRRSLCSGVLFSEQSLMISILPMESLNVDDPLHTMRELLHYYHKRSTITIMRGANPIATLQQDNFRGISISWFSWSLCIFTEFLTFEKNQ